MNSEKNIFSEKKNLKFPTPTIKANIDYTIGSGKMTSYDWLSDLDFDLPQFNVVEVKFKGGRKDYFINKSNFEIHIGDYVVTDATTGYHIGSVSLKGELVRLQLKKKRIEDLSELKSILRVATDEDVKKHLTAVERELPTLFRTREICKEMKLALKLSDVEFQSDNSKATFYYTAESRIDFRELIKILASEFKIRVEMRQISLRQEAARLGAVGSCGREICCSTWMTDMKPVSTAAAKYQNLSLNPSKLSSHCGRIKCSYNFELETYVDAMKDIPVVDKALQTERGDATLQKTDIFRKLMWFSYPRESNWHSISCDQVRKIQKMNKEGKKPVDLMNLEEKEEFIPIETSGSETQRQKQGRKNFRNNKNKKPESAGQQQVENKAVISTAASPDGPKKEFKKNKKYRGNKSKSKNNNPNQ